MISQLLAIQNQEYRIMAATEEDILKIKGTRKIIKETEFKLEHSMVTSIHIHELTSPNSNAVTYDLICFFTDSRYAREAASLFNRAVVNEHQLTVHNHAFAYIIVVLQQINKLYQPLPKPDMDKLLESVYQGIDQNELQKYISHLIYKMDYDAAVLPTKYYLQPNQANYIYFRLGQAFESQKQPEVAIEYYQKIKDSLEDNHFYESAQASLAVLVGEEVSSKLERFKRLLKKPYPTYTLIDVTMIKELWDVIGGYDLLTMVWDQEVSPIVRYHVAQQLYDCDDKPLSSMLALSICTSVTNDRFIRVLDREGAVEHCKRLMVFLWERLDMIDSSPAQKLQFYQYCLNTSHHSEVRCLMFDQMQKDVDSGKVITLVEQVIRLSRIDSYIFHIAGEVLATQYPLLAYCFYERSPNPKMEKEALVSQVSPYLANAILIVAIIDECVKGAQENIASIIQSCQEVLLGKHLNLSASSLIAESLKPKAAPVSPPAELMTGTSSGMRFWKAPEIDTEINKSELEQLHKSN